MSLIVGVAFGMSGEVTNPHNGRTNQWVVHLVCLAATAATGFAVYSFLIQPAKQLQNSARRESKRLDRLLASASGTQQKEKHLRHAVADLTQREEELAERIPATPREAAYLALVTKTANSVGLTIDNYQPGNVTRREQFSEMELQLSAEGSFPAICQFVAGIEKASRLTTIKRMSILARNKANRYPIDMTLVLYFGLNRQSDKEQPRG